VVKLNKKLNKAIKAIIESLIIILVNTIITYFYKGKLLNYYNVIIIVILKKVNKKDYSL